MGIKVLSVDDSRTIRMIVKKAFKPFQIELFEAENGVEGLEMANREKPNLIVLDITMPVMNGVEMLGKLKETPDLMDIPVIMLTAESGKDNVMQIVKMGVKDYMVKPFRGEQLIDRVKNIIDLKPALDAEPATSENTKDQGSFFTAHGNTLILNMPAKINRSITGQMDGTLKQKTGALQKAGAAKIIMDMSQVIDLNMTVIQFVINAVTHCNRSKLPVRFVGTADQLDALKGFQETSNIPLSPSVEQAKATF